MFSFFKKPSVSINSISIPNFGWQQTNNTKQLIQWMPAEQNALASINFYEVAPDLPTIKDATVLRDLYRRNITAASGGLIEAEIIDIQGIACVKTIFKIRREPSGMVYVASVTIPFQDYSFVIKIQAAEAGITGMRDAVIASTLMASGKIKVGDDGFENWFADPYDPSFKGDVLMNKSELPEYDKDFPDHPLSIARGLLSTIEKEITFKPEIATLKPFLK